MNNWHVLIVEDEYDSVQMVSKILTHSGIKVTVASNGYEALDLLNHLQPTVIVMDLAMPRMDGWITLGKIRANPRTADLPVVAITAYHSNDVEIDVDEAGFDGYFAKPIDPYTFVDRLAEIVGDPV